MSENSELDESFLVLCEKAIVKCVTLKAENDWLREQLKRQCLINAIREHTRRPKKRGRPPKPKPEIECVPKKRGRPVVFSDEAAELLDKCVVILKERDGFKTDEEALREVMRSTGRFKSEWHINKELNKFKMYLRKERKLKKATH
jgi:hypothetical protein